MGISKINMKLAAFGGILVQQAGVAFGLQQLGAGPETIVLIAGGIAIVSAQVAVRLGFGDDDDTGGPSAPARLAPA